MTALLKISSPKRKKGPSVKQDEFFPYYAGFPESFAESILTTADLPKDAVIFDPWNGSGTTTNVAFQLGFESKGLDLNPVMVIVARARLASTHDVSNLLKIAKQVLKGVTRLTPAISETDPLKIWFSDVSVALIRSVERRLRRLYCSPTTGTAESSVDNMPRPIAVLYVALFATCRNFTRSFRSSNPTWLKAPDNPESRVDIPAKEFSATFLGHVEKVSGMAQTSRANEPTADVFLGNATIYRKASFADIVLTSPPYCTRLDYTSATVVELAVIDPIVSLTRDELSREMLGSVKVPREAKVYDESWGRTCFEFLTRLRAHESKASTGYYYKTHVDYFDKISRSLGNMAHCLKPEGLAILVVQDSYYKEIHNNLPRILSEMAEQVGMNLVRQEDFVQKNSISKINTSSARYRGAITTTESVLCFKRGVR